MMEFTTERVRSLLEVGLLAAGIGDVVAARTIFDGLEAVRPESEIPLVGRGLSELSAGRHLAAVKCFQDAIEKNPKSEYAISFLAFALRLCGLNQASSSTAQSLIDNGQVAEAIALARSVLEPNMNSSDGSEHGLPGVSVQK